MALGLIVNPGRVLTAKLLLGQVVEGITHCAIGDGDDSFNNPLSPPNPDVEAVSLKNEKVRKRYYKRSFLIANTEGAISVDGVHYSETSSETNIIGFFFRFDEMEANGIAIKEYGFFGGGVVYRDGVNSFLAKEGLFHADTNPMGEVANLGYLYEVKNIPDFNKISDTRLEIVGIIKI